MPRAQGSAWATRTHHISAASIRGISGRPHTAISRACGAALKCRKICTEPSTGPWFPVLGPLVPRLAFQINGAPIPEPATMLLLGPALALIALRKRRRKQGEAVERKAANP